MSGVSRTIQLILLIGILFSGCVTDQSSSNNNSKIVSEKDAWYHLGELVTPGYYADKLSKDLKSGSVNDFLEINPVDTLKSLIPGYEDNAFKGSMENLLKSWDSSVSAATIEGMLLVAQSNCADPDVKLSDTGEIMRLPGALKHFGDLYGNNNPDIKPTIEDLENAKIKVKCYNYQFSNTNTKETPEQRYLIDLTSDIEKLIDFRINARTSGIQQTSADSPQNLQSGEPRIVEIPAGAAATTAKPTPRPIPDGAKPAIKGEMPVDWDALQTHLTKENGGITVGRDYVEEVAYGAQRNKDGVPTFYVGFKVNNPGDCTGGIGIYGPMRKNRRNIFIGLYQDAFKISDELTQNMGDTSNIKLYIEGPFCVAEIPELLDILNENDDRYGFLAEDIEGYVIPNREHLLQKPSI